MGRARLNCPDDIKPLLDEHTAQEIAKIAGVSIDVASRWRAEAGAPRITQYGPTRWTPALCEEFESLYMKGTPTSKLCARFGVTRQRILQVARQMGLPSRATEVQQAAAAERADRAAESREAAEASDDPGRKLDRALRAAGVRQDPPELVELAGRYPDDYVARKVGVTRARVAASRHRNGVPAAARPKLPRVPGAWQATCRRCYELRAIRGWTWAEIEVEVGTSNACHAAKVHATRAGLPWPIFKV